MLYKEEWNNIEKNIYVNKNINSVFIKIESNINLSASGRNLFDNMIKIRKLNNKNLL